MDGFKLLGPGDVAASTFGHAEEVIRRAIEEGFLSMTRLLDYETHSEVCDVPKRIFDDDSSHLFMALDEHGGPDVSSVM